MNPGDEVWVKGTVTTVAGAGVRVAFRVASRLGSTYCGSSTTNKLVGGVVCRVTEVPVEDVGAAPAAAHPPLLGVGAALTAGGELYTRQQHALECAADAVADDIPSNLLPDLLPGVQAMARVAVDAYLAAMRETEAADAV